jgi:hypothetical protein
VTNATKDLDYKFSICLLGLLTEPAELGEVDTPMRLAVVCLASALVFWLIECGLVPIEVSTWSSVADGSPRGM